MGVREDHTAERIKIIEAISHSIWGNCFLPKRRYAVTHPCSVVSQKNENFSDTAEKTPKLASSLSRCCIFWRQVLTFRRNLFPPSSGFTSCVCECWRFLHLPSYKASYGIPKVKTILLLLSTHIIAALWSRLCAARATDLEIPCHASSIMKAFHTYCKGNVLRLVKQVDFKNV